MTAFRSDADLPAGASGVIGVRLVPPLVAAGHDVAGMTRSPANVERPAALGAMVLGAGGLLIRYGQFYGPGTFYEGEPPPPPRIQIDDAAARTVLLLKAPSGTVTIAVD